MSETIYNSNFLGADKLREYNMFAEEYFTGSDIKLIANNTEIKQISMIQYELQEQLKPIYGYASYVYDDVAVGSRIVTGTFVCPMKNLAKNQDFKCLPDKKYKLGASKDIKDFDYQISSSVENQKTEEYTKFIENEKVYLSPTSNVEIFQITQDEVIVKEETDTYLLVYQVNQNRSGYIWK